MLFALSIVFHSYLLAFLNPIVNAKPILNSTIYSPLQLSKHYDVYPYISNFPCQFSVKFSQDSLDMLHIKMDKIEFPYEVKVFTKAGKEMSSSMYSFQKEIQLPLYMYERGAYIIAVNTASKNLYDYTLLLIK